MKIVGPTIVEPWRDLIDSAGTLGELKKLRERMQGYRVLDPACGSGNFLYIAYRELKRLEARLFERMGEKDRSFKGQQQIGFVSARQFFGIDINPFAVEIAKVTMMIARKLAIDELHIHETALPLDRLDDNFIAGDALITPFKNGNAFPTMLFAEIDVDPWAVGRIALADWPKADVIIGNPPFLGTKRLKPERGADYVNAVRRMFPDVPGMADYCVYWFRLAHDRLPECTHNDPIAGRAGLVGTQNIRNNQSRVGGLDHVVKTGTIIEAVDNQPWSGEANVHVSIVNWVKTKSAKLLPKKRTLWQKDNPSRERQRIRKRGEGPASKEFDLKSRACNVINSALSCDVDLSGAKWLEYNMVPQRSYNGQMLGHEAFLLTESERRQIVDKDPKSATVIYPYLNGRELLASGGRPDRFVLDFEQRDQFEAASFRGAFDWVRRRVLPDRERKAKIGIDATGKKRPHHKAFLARWWQLSFGRPELIAQIHHLRRYLCCSLVTKRPIFVFVNPAIRPSNLLQVFTFDDDYSFGILQSQIHWGWFVQKCSKLKSDFRYGEGVWNTFSWPQKPRAKQVRAVAKAGRDVRKVRANALRQVEGGLREVYQMLELSGDNPLKDAHAALDEAVMEAYGFSPGEDLLGQLLELNLDVAKRIERGESVTSPGVPQNYPNPEELVTDDCIQP